MTVSSLHKLVDTVLSVLRRLDIARLQSVNRSQAAAIMGVSDDWLARHIDDFHSWKAGSNVMVTLTSIAEYQEKHRNGKAQTGHVAPAHDSVNDTII